MSITAIALAAGFVVLAAMIGLAQTQREPAKPGAPEKTPPPKAKTEQKAPPGNVEEQERTEPGRAKEGPEHAAAFTLRGTKDTPPYFHDGRLLTLEDTVELFNLVLGTKLTEEEKHALVAFMRCL